MKNCQNNANKVKKSKSGLDIALMFVAAFLIIFIISIEVMFYILGDVPDSLIVGVLGAGGVECVLSAFVYLFKVKYKKPSDEECDEFDAS